MDRTDALMKGGLRALLREIITGGSKKEVVVPIRPVKSEYQINLEESGWKFRSNVDADNEVIDYTRNMNTFRLLRKDCRRFFPEKRIGLFRAHDMYGERIPSERKMVAVYTQDR